MGKLKYKWTASDSDLRKAFDVRRQVFVGEQGISESLVFDNQDRDALHVVVEDGKRAIGTARIRFIGNDKAKLERMAVSKSSRHKGVGKGIIAFLDAELRDKQIQQLVIHAQEGAVEFYKSCGFKQSGSPFREANIKHIKMFRRL
jgi:predicted GNAT family N-acyltransferase